MRSVGVLVCAGSVVDDVFAVSNIQSGSQTNHIKRWRQNEMKLFIWRESFESTHYRMQMDEEEKKQSEQMHKVFSMAF